MKIKTNAFEFCLLLISWFLTCEKMSGLRSLALGGLGGAGGVLIARILFPAPDITYQEKVLSPAQLEAQLSPEPQFFSLKLKKFAYRANRKKCIFDDICNP